MGREGDESTEVVGTKEEAKDKMTAYQNRSKRAKGRFACDTVQIDEATAKAKAEELYANEGRRLRDDYNVVGYVAFTPKDDQKVDTDPNVLNERKVASDSLLALWNESTYKLDDKGRAECSVCSSLIKLERSRSAKDGLCDVCNQRDDSTGWIPYPQLQYDRYGSEADNTRKRKQYDLELSELKDTFKTVVDATTTPAAYKLPQFETVFKKRPLFQQKQETKDRVRQNVIALNNTRKRVRSAQKSDDVKYVVITGYLSGHDEWQKDEDDDEMDSY
jgi:hypothetical protein